MKRNKISAILALTEEPGDLGAIAEHRPVALLPFASRYRMIDFALSNLAAADVESVALFIGYSGRSVYDHIRSGIPWGFGSAINGGIFTFSQHKNKYDLAKAHGRMNTFYEDPLAFIKRAKTDYLFIAGSRILANVDIEAVKNQHVASRKEVTLIYRDASTATRLTQGVPYELVRLDRAGNFDELQTRPISFDFDQRINFNMNMYIIKTETMEKLIYQAYCDEHYTTLDHLIKLYLPQLSVNLYQYKGFFSIVDSLKSYFNLNQAVLKPEAFKSLFYSGACPIITKQKNGVPSFFSEDSIVHDAQIATDCTIHGEVVNSLISRGVCVGKRAGVHHAIVYQGCQIAEDAYIEYAILDKGVIVKPGAVIKGSPDHIVVVSKGSVIEA